MKHAYVTKRIAPSGYVAVTRKLAEVLYDEWYPVTLCGNNVNSFHIFHNWRLGCTIEKLEYGEDTFDSLVNSFMSYLEKELGTYPVFYVKSEVVNNMDLSILKREKA